MVRSSSPLLLLATLALGVLIGLNLDNRRARTVSAQATKPLKPSEDVGPELAVGSRKATPEDGVYGQLARQYAQFAAINKTFELVSKAVSPSVVHIVSHKPGNRQENPQVKEVEESGSGVIVRSDGIPGLFVMTNNHVVANAGVSQIDILLNDGRTMHPVRVWTDLKADIAVLKLDRDNLPAARLGDSDDTPVGTWVLAIGSPFGLAQSVTQGIISGRGRHELDLEILGVENQEFLQTDAAINPGNSGGPLVNMKGEVIGINIAIISQGGGSEGVGLSIPINLARWIMSQLLTHGRVTRGALGVNLEPEFGADQAMAIGLERPRGARIRDVGENSPASVSGVKVGDVILKFNGVDVDDLNHLINLVSMAPIGEPANVLLWRDRREMSLKVTVADKGRIAIQAARPPATRPPASTEVDGLELITLDSVAARRMGLPEAMRGAAVLKVEPESPLASYFRPLDVIHSIGGRPVQTAEEVVQALGSKRGAAGLELGIHREVNGGFQRSKFRVP